MYKQYMYKKIKLDFNIFKAIAYFGYDAIILFLLLHFPLMALPAWDGYIRFTILFSPTQRFYSHLNILFIIPVPCFVKNVYTTEWRTNTFSGICYVN